MSLVEKERKGAKMYLKQLDREIKDKEFIVKNVGSQWGVDKTNFSPSRTLRLIVC